MTGRIDHHDDAENHGLKLGGVELSKKPMAHSVAIDIEPQATATVSSMRKISRKTEITVKVNTQI